MRRCDVLVVGGGPAGAICAWALGEAGADVMLLDRARFPRDKPCAGWVTPSVFRTIGVTPQDYAATGRTLQSFAAFQTSVMDTRTCTTAFPSPVSYGIIRAEFDAWLLGRIRTPVLEATAVTSVRRAPGEWILNEAFAAPVIVGAGGHFCPVARAVRHPRVPPGSDLDLPPTGSGSDLDFPITDGKSRSDPGAGRGRSRSDPGRGRERVVLAKQMEIRIGRDDRCGISGTMPELYFCKDLEGYGWAIRKGNVLNVGIGRRVGTPFRAHVLDFARFLTRQKKVPVAALDTRLWHGHAYALAGDTAVVADGIVLIGDAAGLAAAESGEGIGPAIESALQAAHAISTGDGRTRDFPVYAAWVAGRVAPRSLSTAIRRAAPAAVGRALLGRPTVARHVIEGFFLRA